MAQSIFRERCDHRTRGVESLADRVIQDHQQAMYAWNVQETVSECIDQQHFLNEIWQESLKCAIDGNISDIVELDSHGYFLLDVFSRSVEAFAVVLRSVESAEQMGHRVEGAAQFRRGCAEARKLRHRIRHRWPMADEDAMKRSLAEFREGRSRPVGEIINELRGGNS